jgi:hypothetical protein
MKDRWFSVPDACAYELGDAFKGGVIVQIQRDHNRVLVRYL